MPAAFERYAAFLSFLLTLGPKLQAIWPKLQAWVATTTDLVTAVKGLIPSTTPAAGTLSICVPTDEELALEGQVAELIAGPNAAFDGSLLRALWQFGRENPALLQFLISLLKGG